MTRHAISSLLFVLLSASFGMAREGFEGRACDDHDPCTIDDKFVNGMCQGAPRTCDDGLSCTEDLCDRGTGRCSIGLRLDSCLIGGICYRDGDPDPFDACRVCRPARSAQDWTPTTTCDDGDPCTLDDRCHEGRCAGSAYTCGGVGFCTASRCDGKGGCIDEPLAGHCRIDGFCLREGQSHPTEACLRCDPHVAADRWTPATGSSCLGGNCIDGVCRATVVIEIAGEGTGRVVGPGFTCNDACVQTVAPERRIDLTVVATDGSEFQGWEGACSGLAPCSLLAFGEMRVTANFGRGSFNLPSGLATLQVVRSGRGRVFGADGRISCGSTCVAQLPNGTDVTLTAEAAIGYRFAGWEKACRGPSLTCSAVVSGTTEVEAVFVPLASR